MKKNIRILQVALFFGVCLTLPFLSGAEYRLTFHIPKTLSSKANTSTKLTAAEQDPRPQYFSFLDADDEFTLTTPPIHAEARLGMLSSNPAWIAFLGKTEDLVQAYGTDITITDIRISSRPYTSTTVIMEKTPK